MPSYEMALILKASERTGLAASLKRNLLLLMKHGAIIKSVDNAGLRRLPSVMHRHGERHLEGNYFLVNMEHPTNIKDEVKSYMRMDAAILKSHVCRSEDGFIPPCSLPDSEECRFGEITNPNYEKTARRRHGFRWY